MRYGPLFRERNIDMTIVTAMRPEQPRREVRNGVTIERVGNPGKGVASVGSFLVRALLHAAMARRRPDFVLLLSVAPVVPLLLLMLRLKGIKSIYVSTMARLDTERPQRIRTRMVNRLKFLTYNAFDYLVCSTQTLAEDLTVLGIRQEKVNAIPNGVSLTRFRPAASPDEILGLRRRLDLPVDEPIVLYVGLRIDRKGVVELIQAWKRYRAGGGAGWLLMIGQELRGDPELEHFYERWDQCVAQIAAADQIEMRDAQERIEEYYRAADLFVFLSELEGTPNVIPEAMASGLPVLSTRFRGFSPELGRDGSELIVTDRDPEKVSGELSRLVKDPELRRVLGMSGRAWVERYQAIDKTIERYCMLLEK